ncbi:MAG TPA: hypothetical protein VFW68_02850 [Rhodocyclaceae bacterium]|nr:hypothetical protein [Rhodocyclaceae bacterium]
MSTEAIVITLFLVAAVIWKARNGAPLPKQFKDRVCQGVGWRRAFPTASKEDIRSFLSVFVEAFVFSGKQRLKFNPNDEILSIYRALYPHRWQPDALEFETLAKLVEKNYRVNFSEAWKDGLTLGELFAVAHGIARHQ